MQSEHLLPGFTLLRLVTASIRILAPRYEQEKEERRVLNQVLSTYVSSQVNKHIVRVRGLSHKYYNIYTYSSKSDDIENRVSGSL